METLSFSKCVLWGSTRSLPLYVYLVEQVQFGHGVPSSTNFWRSGTILNIFLWAKQTKMRGPERPSYVHKNCQSAKRRSPKGRATRLQKLAMLDSKETIPYPLRAELRLQKQ